MTRKLSAAEKELYQRIDEVLHYVWDPLDVSEIPDVRDEYASYVPHVFSLLINRGKTDDIVDFLVATETKKMGLAGEERARSHAKKIADLLGDYRDVIQERAESQTQR